MDSRDSCTGWLRDHLEGEARGAAREERRQAEKEARMDEIISDCLQNLIRDRDEVFEAVGWGYEDHPDFPAMPSAMFRVAASYTTAGAESVDKMVDEAKKARDAMADDLALHIGHALLTDNHAELGRLVASYAKPYLIKTARRQAEDL